MTTLSLVSVASSRKRLQVNWWVLIGMLAVAAPWLMIGAVLHWWMA